MSLERPWAAGLLSLGFVIGGPGPGDPGADTIARAAFELARVVFDQGSAKSADGFRLERGEGQPVLVVPDDERLVYEAHLDIAILEAAVGTVVQTTRVEPYRPASILIGSAGRADGLETASIRLHAEGDYAFYEVDSTIETLILPEEWPHVRYSQTSEGTERRRREIYLGTREGKPTASYQRDTDRGAPAGTRIWREATYREIPAGTLDMLSAVFMARTLIHEGKDELSFPLIDKTRVWLLQLSRGEARRMKTGAGTFDVVEVVLTPGPYPGETIEQEKLDQFEGVFGIHGSIHLWVEQRTGIAVRIQGDLPVGPITLGIDVILERFSGTPPEFAPVE